MKKVLSVLLAFIFFIELFPIFSLYSSADEIQKAMFVYDNVNCTCNAKNHNPNSDYPYRLPFDFIGPSSKKDDVFAPFDCKIVKIDKKNGHTVCFESISPVHCADNTVGYVTFFLTHDDDITNLKEGMSFSQGDVIYQEGTTGDYVGQYGVHIHLEVCKGKYSDVGGSFWNFVRSKSRVAYPDDIFFIKDNAKIVNSGGLDWKRVSTSGNYEQTPFDQCITISDTTKQSEITSSSVILRCRLDYSSYLAGNVVNVGVDIGTSANNVSYVANDVNSDGWGDGQSFYYNIGKKGYSFTPGNTYYYRFYAKNAKGDVYHTEIKSFTVPTTGANAPSFQSSVNIEITTQESEITANSVILRGKLNYIKSGADKATIVGLDIGTSVSNVEWLTRDESNAGFNDGMTFYYDIGSKGFSFTPGSTYYYRFYAKNAAGDVYHTAISSFTVPNNAASFQSCVNLTNETKESEITESSVIVRCKLQYISNDAGKAVEVGIDCGASADSMTNLSYDTNNNGFSDAMTFFYNLGNKGLTMKPGNTYYYRFYAKNSSGETYYSPVYSFTVPGHEHEFTEEGFEEEHPHRIYFECSCGERYYTEENKYSLVYHEAKEATCTEVGWDAYYTCPGCSYSTYNEIAPTGHTLIHVDAMAPTCDNYGNSAYDYCTECDYNTYEELEPLGHYLIHHNGKAPTCTEIGWDAYDTCSRCDYTTYNEIEALGHRHTEIRNAVSVTADQEGYTGDKYCTDCGTLLQSGTVIPKLAPPAATELSMQIYGSSFKIDGNRKINQYRSKFLTGTEHTVIYTGNDFLYWTDITGMVLSENVEYTFTFMNTTTLFAVTKNTESGIACVLILTGSGSGQIVAADSVTSSEVTALELPAVGNFSGYVFSGWTVIDIDNASETTITSGDNSEVYNCMASLINSGVKNIVLKPYFDVANANEIHTVTVIYKCGENTTTKQYSVAGDRVKIYAADETYLGQAFAGWYSGDNLICPNKKYVALVDKDITVTVKYSNDDTVTSRPIVETLSYTADNSTGTNKLVHLSLHNVPDEYDVIGYGTIYSISVSSELELKIENVDGAAVRKIEKSGSQNGIMTSNITVGSAVSTVVYVRGYVTVKDSQNVISTYYTDVLSGSFNSLNNAGGNDSGGGEI